MATTPTSEILATIKAVKEMQAILKTLLDAVNQIGDSLERLGERVGKLEQDISPQHPPPA